MPAKLRPLAIAVAGVLAAALVHSAVGARTGDGRLTTADGDTVEITAQARAAGPTFAPGVGPAVRAWVTDAIGRARPEAARLIGEVDGLVEVRTFAATGTTVGVTRSHDRGFIVDLNTTYLDAEHRGDRATVVLHEFGHVIDFALVPEATNATLDAQIPRGGPCGVAVDCDRPEERFADTFATWALNGAVSAAGAGYGIPAPASLESWGEPLARLAATLGRP